jgi:hypothetical protein
MNKATSRRLYWYTTDGCKSLTALLLQIVALQDAPRERRPFWLHYRPAYYAPAQFHVAEYSASESSPSRWHERRAHGPVVGLYDLSRSPAPNCTRGASCPLAVSDRPVASGRVARLLEKRKTLAN